MRVKKLNSDKEVLLSVKEYLIDWKKDGASKLEIAFRDLIYPAWKHHIVLFQCRIPGSLLRLDFLNCNKRLCVEIDGAQHNKFNKHFHNNNKLNWVSSIKRDWEKEEWLKQNNIKLIHLEEKDLKEFNPKLIEEKYGINII